MRVLIKLTAWAIANFLLFFALAVHANTFFVDANGSNPLPPFSDWSTAATNIQDAIDASANGDFVIVTNGVYSTGGHSMDGIITNRVSLNKPIVVQSVNGPRVTIIQGAGQLNGPNAVRCAWITNNATLAGFTLESGATRINAGTSGSGGGIFGSSKNLSVVANCIVVSNTAYTSGSAAYNVSLVNCLLATNTSSTTAFNCLLRNCTVISNQSSAAVYNSTATNCIIYYNTGNVGGTVGSYAYCCIPTASGNGNISSPPNFFADGVHLSASSPCIGAGTNIATGTDLFGSLWRTPPSIGCCEWGVPVVVPQPTIKVTSLARIGVNVAATGQPPLTYFWTQNGDVVQDGNFFANSGSSNLVLTAPECTGAYQVIVSNAFGVVTSSVAQVTIHGVDAGNASSAAPYTSWDTAASTIQDAVDVSTPGDFIFVTNGTYATGGRSVDGILTNRVVVDMPITVHSLNGANATIIQGAWDPVAATTPFSYVGNGPNAVRCVWLTNGATLMGFTLRNGATSASNSIYGGGVYCTGNGATVANCIFTNNSAVGGGGAAGGTIINSFFTQNITKLYGGGAYNCNLRNCTIWNNSSTLPPSSHAGAGIYQSAAYNCIIAANYDDYPFFTGEDNYYPNLTPAISYSCSYPLPSGVSNINSAISSPTFVDSFHISATSPCRGAGSATYASGTDMDGEPWSNPPSMGCDEVVDADLGGALMPYITELGGTNGVVGKSIPFLGYVSGKASRVSWAFDNGPVITNANWFYNNRWTNTGIYNVYFTAYNTDNPSGVTTNLTVLISPIFQPSLQPIYTTNNWVQLSFPSQRFVTYTILGATNLTPPISWTFLSAYGGTGDVMQFTDIFAPNYTSRFYQIQAQ